MRCRSESEKRTVVDLSLSFFMRGNSCIRTIGLSLPKSSEKAQRQLDDISEVSLREEFQSALHRNREGDV
jgi:hypothetical protein